MGRRGGPTGANRGRGKRAPQGTAHSEARRGGRATTEGRILCCWSQGAARCCKGPSWGRRREDPRGASGSGGPWRLRAQGRSGGAAAAGAGGAPAAVGPTDTAAAEGAAQGKEGSRGGCCSGSLCRWWCCNPKPSPFFAGCSRMEHLLAARSETGRYRYPLNVGAAAGAVLVAGAE